MAGYLCSQNPSPALKCLCHTHTQRYTAPKAAYLSKTHRRSHTPHTLESPAKPYANRPRFGFEPAAHPKRSVTEHNLTLFCSSGRRTSNASPRHPQQRRNGRAAAATTAAAETPTPQTHLTLRQCSNPMQSRLLALQMPSKQLQQAAALRGAAQ